MILPCKTAISQYFSGKMASAIGKSIPSMTLRKSPGEFQDFPARLPLQSPLKSTNFPASQSKTKCEVMLKIHFPSFSIIFHHFPSCSIMFHHFPSFSIMFHHVPSFSIMFHHFPWFSIIYPLKTSILGYVLVVHPPFLGRSRRSPRLSAAHRGAPGLWRIAGHRLHGCLRAGAEPRFYRKWMDNGGFNNRFNPWNLGL